MSEACYDGFTRLVDDGQTVLSPCAEQHFMLAIAALEQARAHMMLAHYLVMQGK